MDFYYLVLFINYFQLIKFINLFYIGDQNKKLEMDVGLLYFYFFNNCKKYEKDKTKQEK